MFRRAGLSWLVGLLFGLAAAAAVLALLVQLVRLEPPEPPPAHIVAVQQVAAEYTLVEVPVVAAGLALRVALVEVGLLLLAVAQWAGLELLRML